MFNSIQGLSIKIRPFDSNWIPRYHSFILIKTTEEASNNVGVVAYCDESVSVENTDTREGRFIGESSEY